MKVTNWRRKLAASLVAGGLFVPVAAPAADLNTNLVVDPSFENVDTNIGGPFGSHRLLSWPETNADGNLDDDAFAFQYSQNYAGVNTPAGAGLRHFSGGFGTTAGQTVLSQTASVSTGQTGTLIPNGEAAYSLSGYFSSYLTQADSSRVRVRFLDAGSAELGQVDIGGAAFVASLGLMPGTFGQHRDWGQDFTGGIIPIGTSSVEVQVISDVSAGNHDGYLDLVDFRVLNAADLLMFLEVNTATGQTRLRNLTGEAVNIDYYEIVSAGNSLNATSWNSLQDQNLAGFPAGNGSGNGWEEAGGSTAGILSESYLQGNSAVADQASVGLGAAFNTGGTQDLVFRYSAVAGSGGLPDGDFNSDGSVDAADYTVWRDTLGDQANYDLWVANFGSTGGPSGPGALVTGFVRYVTSGSGTAVVPEPASVVLVGIGLCLMVAVGRQGNGPDRN